MDPALSHKVRQTWSFFQNSTVNRLERRAAAETWRSGVLGSSRASLAPVPAPPVSRRDKTAANVAATSFGVQPYNSPHQTEVVQVTASLYRTTTSDSRSGPYRHNGSCRRPEQHGPRTKRMSRGARWPYFPAEAKAGEETEQRGAEGGTWLSHGFRTTRWSFQVYLASSGASYSCRLV